MQKRRVLAWLCLACIICSVLSPAVFAADWISIDEMGIDPWGELDQITESLGGTSATSVEVDDEPIYTLSDDVDVGIMPLLDVSELSWKMTPAGFTAYGIDNDGSEWEGVPVNSVPMDLAPGVGVLSSFPSSSDLLGWYIPGRLQPVNSKIVPSRFGSWVGRQAIISGDPGITNDSGFRFEGGTCTFELQNWEEEKGVSSLQILDLEIGFGLEYGYWNDYDSNSLLPSGSLQAQRMRGGRISSVNLLINGKDVGPIDCEFSSKPSQSANGRYPFWHYVNIKDSVVTFDEQMVRSVAIVLYIEGAVWEGPDNTYSGGLSALPCFTSGHAVISRSSRLVSGVDPAAENTGLLKGIIEFLQSIVEGIKNIGKSIAELPGKIANAVIEGLKSLFIPSDADITDLKAKYEALLSERLGFVWQAGEWLVTFGQSVIEAVRSDEEYAFVFPGVHITLPEGEFTIIEEMPVSLDNAVMDVIRPALGTIVTIICVIAFINTAEHMVVAIVSGASYFEFLKGDGDDVD